uniref:Maf-like protein n=1 Tax=Candidatus Kentrum sp. TUN TaxID=2126343 RepID=A0A451A3Q4_9GAMM|nr:MAG: Maf-like protein [Candidatus Kentron sp. TUN]
MVFRKLTPEQIAGYVDKEKPFDCAGGFKSEPLKAALFERMEGETSTALVSSPLIRLLNMLSGAGGGCI